MGENPQPGIRRANRFGAAGPRAPWFYLQFTSRVGSYRGILVNYNLYTSDGETILIAKIIVQKQTKKKEKETKRWAKERIK